MQPLLKSYDYFSAGSRLIHNNLNTQSVNLIRDNAHTSTASTSPQGTTD